MSVIFAITAIFFTSILMVIVVQIIPNKIKKVSIALIAIIIITTATISMYLLNPSFRKNINMIFNADSHHRCVVNNQSFYLPLPANTTLNYRTSDTQAIYLTKASLDEILEFYQFVAESTPTSKTNDEKLELLLRFSAINFILIAEDKDDIREMTITTKQTQGDGSIKTQGDGSIVLTD